MNRLVRWLGGTPEKRATLALVCLCAILYVPLAGNYGMWDPWETHYGEIARQMAQRNDWVSLWWPGSPQDRIEVFHKPVLHFWLMALSLKAFGLEWGHPSPDEMVRDWRPEWACRLPNLLLSLVAIWAVWQLVARLAGRRAATLSALILATSSQWALITRQAMTDMPFVAPMTIALALAGLALLGPPEEFETPLLRQELFVRRRRLGSIPLATSFWVFLALFAVAVLPQLIVISAQLEWIFGLGPLRVRTIGLVPMLPYFICFFAALYVCAGARTRRQLYLFSAYVLGALACLAKGPAGIALPGMVLVLYLVVAGRWRDLWFKLELPRGVLLFAATACPWYHAMLIRHGAPFWIEFIGDNYVRRAEGRHGDRGTFDYYLQYIGYGMFPWSGIVTLGGILSFPRLRDKGVRAQLIGYAIVWFLVELVTVSLVNTKFHHYILPALPALAVLAGLFLDELLRAPTKAQLWGLGLIALPLTLVCGRDLAAFQPRLLWEFNYDYVNAPGTGRPWPLVAIYGDRYEYGVPIVAFTVATTLAVAALLAAAWRTRATVEQAEPADSVRSPLPYLVLLVLALAVGIALGPATPGGLAPTISKLAWVWPTLIMLVALAVYSPSLLRALVRGRAVAAAALVALAVAWTGFMLDGVLVDLSPHWAQKHVVAAYYRARRSADEPLIAWQLYWRGENFYTRNEIYDPKKPATEKTVFMGDRNSEKLQEYLKTHRGRRVFFLVERARYESLRQLLPVDVRPTLQVVDQSNNKLYLASAQLGESRPLGTRSERFEQEIR
jgi:4-amino-4-deoxy-L-arabinose transferase-like glycosyltransferase